VARPAGDGGESRQWDELKKPHGEEHLSITVRSRESGNPETPALPLLGPRFRGDERERT
jgi:hypothetical protein